MSQLREMIVSRLDLISRVHASQLTRTPRDVSSRVIAEHVIQDVVALPGAKPNRIKPMRNAPRRGASYCVRIPSSVYPAIRARSISQTSALWTTPQPWSYRRLRLAASAGCGRLGDFAGVQLAGPRAHFGRMGADCRNYSRLPELCDSTRRERPQPGATFGMGSADQGHGRVPAHPAVH